MSLKNELVSAHSKITEDLDRTVQFWLNHSHDELHGGFFNCLGSDGSRYDDVKYGWIQGRQVWTYARLYNEVERFKTSEILHAATKGAEFLLANGRDQQTGKCYFLMQRDGRPIKIQRTIFSEVFFTMGMSELSRAYSHIPGDAVEKYKAAAFDMMDRIAYWVRIDDSGLGRPKLSGMEPTNVLNVPMMICCLVTQMETCFPNMEEEKKKSFNDLRGWAINQILVHSQRNGTAVLENVSHTGEEMSGSTGRLMIPGHAIECGWFLLEYARKHDDKILINKAISLFMEAPFKMGWDEKEGGLFYFLDANGLSPTQLEWDQKMWWAHNEAMISFLMAFATTGEIKHWHKFQKVMEYSYSHFVDRENGEWWGYLHRDGTVNLDFKGGPFKGCFHVPRCLMMCEQMLTTLIQHQ